ncbi:MAG TPA: LptF/LptG family permease, partial [Clostridia bacterium]|nr:LptF/LptG family permease [Clostridia bacterium]
MRLLDRYLLRELLVPLGYCLSGFFIFWMASDLFSSLRSLQNNKLLPMDILQLYLIRAPEFLVVVLPVAFLLALLYTLTNHARHHEITAIRAAGISMWRLAVPYFLMGVICSVSVLALNELWVPYSVEAAATIKDRRTAGPGQFRSKTMARNLGFDNSRDQRLWQISIYNFDTGEMINPQVIWTKPDGTRLWMKADRGWRTNDTWVFANLGLFRESVSNDPPLVPVLQTNLLAVPEFTETPEQIRSEVKI